MLSLLLAALVPPLQEPPTLPAPEAAAAPALDGRLELDEWRAAARVPLATGIEVLVLRAASRVYLGFRMPTPPCLVSVHVARGDEVRTLHVSTALSDVSYRRDGDRWRRAAPPRFDAERTDDGPEAVRERVVFEESHGWIGSIVGRGAPGELELRLDAALVDATDVRLSLAVHTFEPAREVAVWPRGLADDAAAARCNRPIPEHVTLDPARWGRLAPPARATVEYYAHSGVGVRIGGRLLVFDYVGSEMEPREAGLLTAAGVAGGVVFVSHAHADHFDPAVLDWRSAPGVRFVLSSDVVEQRGFDSALLEEAPELVTVVEPRRSYTLDGGRLVVHTAGSTDAGVSFLVEADGLRIFHAGDLALWGWRAGQVAAVEEAFLAELDVLAEHGPADLAFVCADLRLPDHARLSGADLAVALLEPAVTVPIHNHGRQAEAVAALVGLLDDVGLETVVLPVAAHGDALPLPAVPRSQ